MTRGERGAVIPFVASGIVLLAALCLALSMVGGVLVTRRELQSAADLAALAGAVAIQHGRDGCAEAGRVADRNDAFVESCSADGQYLTLHVSRRTPVMLGRHWEVLAVARAGPS